MNVVRGGRGAANIAKLLERPQPQDWLVRSTIRSLHAALRFVLTDILNLRPIRRKRHEHKTNDTLPKSPRMVETSGRAP